MTIPYALSVSHFINSVGADAGFAAIIGLAILVLLYFAQARETATLRDQAADHADHVQHLEYRIAQLARGGVPAPAPAPAQTSVPAPAPRTGAQPVAAPPASRTVAPGQVPAPVVAPAAPAGVGAPALASATRLIPAFDEGAISVRATGAPVAAAAPARAGGQAPPRAPVRNGATRPPAPAPRRPSAPPPRSGARSLVLALAALALVAVVVVALLILTSSGGGSSSKSSSSAAQTTSTSARARRRAARSRGAIKPASVTVAVLNGTATTNLAHDISLKLGAAGYKLGHIATATDQTQTATVVGYLSGQRRSALVVAKSLGLGPASVQPVGPSNQAVACPQGASCTAQVVVTVGSDLASAATTSTAPGVTGAGSGTTTAASTT